MSAKLKVTLALCALCLSQPMTLQSQTATDPWFGRSSKPRDFEPPRAPLGRFTIELPKNWQIVPGYGQMVFGAAEKTRNNLPAAAIVLEQTQLRGTLAPRDLTSTIAEVELTAIRERQPGGQNFEQQLKDVDGKRFVFIQYMKTGTGGPDRVVQYSIPAGSVMYRLICVAPAAQIARYQPMFAHVAASFNPTDTATR